MRDTETGRGRSRQGNSHAAHLRKPAHELHGELREERPRRLVQVHRQPQHRREHSAEQLGVVARVALLAGGWVRGCAAHLVHACMCFFFVGLARRFEPGSGREGERNTRERARNRGNQNKKTKSSLRREPRIAIAIAITAAVAVAIAVAVTQPTSSTTIVFRRLPSPTARRVNHKSAEASIPPAARVPVYLSPLAGSAPSPPTSHCPECKSSSKRRPSSLPPYHGRPRGRRDTPRPDFWSTSSPGASTLEPSLRPRGSATTRTNLPQQLPSEKCRQLPSKLVWHPPLPCRPRGRGDTPRPGSWSAWSPRGGRAPPASAAPRRGRS